jgi:hypothetical protein
MESQHDQEFASYDLVSEYKETFQRLYHFQNKPAPLSYCCKPLQSYTYFQHVQPLPYPLLPETYFYHLPISRQSHPLPTDSWLYPSQGATHTEKIILLAMPASQGGKRGGELSPMNRCARS